MRAYLLFLEQSQSALNIRLAPCQSHGRFTEKCWMVGICLLLQYLEYRFPSCMILFFLTSNTFFVCDWRTHHVPRVLFALACCSVLQCVAVCCGAYTTHHVPRVLYAPPAAQHRLLMLATSPITEHWTLATSFVHQLVFVHQLESLPNRKNA